ncbi:glucanotransferase domain of glycogen debranching enzyme-domain-containing protein [Chytriomyces sp. MP71]|nr:glucanotransferase domain of glycogen debranching enzyme-domain-containing protein [Chytriomyces sp. MP71]
MGAVVVDPKLTVKNKLLPLDAVCCLTVVPKWMPTIDKWGPFLQSFAGAGYNMVHYAPLNMRGTSNSPYSIYDQLAFSNDLFEPGSYLSEDDKERQLHDVLIRSKDEFGILSITDVVWNHTAHNSKWLEEHPEAGYNLETAPHLRAAYELDEAIISLDKDLAQASIPTALQTEEHLTQVMHIFKDFTLPRLRLWEFYIVNVADRLSEFKLAWEPFGKTRDPDAKPDNALLSSGLKAWANALRTSALSIDTHLGTRFKKRVHVSNAVKLMERLTSGRDSTESVLKMYTNILNEVNDPLYAEANADIAAIVANVWSRARYLRVDSHGPKLGPISRKDPLVDTYFTRLAFNENTRNFHSDALCLANNGWIWNGDPLSNFAGPDSKAYLRRDVIAWGDCVKLRYGDGPESNPWLWQHQRAYTEKMARLFHGFRIDNCHSTPIHVATYLLDAARIINPDLYVIAELFTGSEETDVTFVSKLGINSLIREAMSAWDPKEMSRLVHRYGGTPIGEIFR